MGLPRSGIPPRGGALAPGRGAADGGAKYTGRGPVWGTIKRRGVCAAAIPAGRVGSPARPIPGAGCPGTAGRAVPGRVSAAGNACNGDDGTSPSATEGTSDSVISDVAGTTSLSSSAAIWSSITGSEGCAVPAADDRCAGGVAEDAGTGGFGGITIFAGGRATDWGVMKRGAGLSGSAGAAGVALATGAIGFVTELAGRTAEGGATV